MSFVSSTRKELTELIVRSGQHMVAAEDAIAVADRARAYEAHYKLMQVYQRMSEMTRQLAHEQRQAMQTLAGATTASEQQRGAVSVRFLLTPHFLSTQAIAKANYMDFTQSRLRMTMSSVMGTRLVLRTQ
jgi:signal transduction histidine kinase